MAFPTTGVLDSFTGSDEDPIATNWSNPIISGDNELRRVSNQLAKDNDSPDWGSGYYDIATFGPDAEAYGTIAVDAGQIEIMLRIQSVGTAGLDGYFLHCTLTGTDFQLWEVLNNSQSQLGATVAQAVAVNDSIGIEAIGTTIKGYHKPAAGSWTEIISRTDATTNAAGHIGVVMNEDNVRLDDFGGGTVVVAGGDPEGKLVGGKLLRGGLLRGGVLVN